MNSFERKIMSKINELQIKIKNANKLLDAVPCLIIDGAQALGDSERDWQTNINTIFLLNGLHKSWILNLKNPTAQPQPSTIQIEFINNIVRNQAYTILSEYIIDNEIDCLISKDEIYPLIIN